MCCAGSEEGQNEVSGSSFMSRWKDMDWNLPESGNTYESAQLAVLMDIRDELKHLNSVLHCTRFRGIPNVLYNIERNTRPKKKKAKLKIVKRVA